MLSEVDSPIAEPLPRLTSALRAFGICAADGGFDEELPLTREQLEERVRQKKLHLVQINDSSHAKKENGAVESVSIPTQDCGIYGSTSEDEEKVVLSEFGYKVSFREIHPLRLEDVLQYASKYKEQQILRKRKNFRNSSPLLDTTPKTSSNALCQDQTNVANAGNDSTTSFTESTLELRLSDVFNLHFNNSENVDTTALRSIQTAVLELLGSGKTEDELQGELFDLLGFERFKVKRCLLIIFISFTFKHTIHTTNMFNFYY